MFVERHCITASATAKSTSESGYSRNQPLVTRNPVNVERAALSKYATATAFWNNQSPVKLNCKQQYPSHFLLKIRTAIEVVVPGVAPSPKQPELPATKVVSSWICTNSQPLVACWSMAC